MQQVVNGISYKTNNDLKQNCDLTYWSPVFLGVWTIPNYLFNLTKLFCSGSIFPVEQVVVWVLHPVSGLPFPDLHFLTIYNLRHQQNS